KVFQFRTVRAVAVAYLQSLDRQRLTHSLIPRIGERHCNVIQSPPGSCRGRCWLHYACLTASGARPTLPGMRETSNSYHLRKARGDFDNYLKGSGIDIGSGPDPLKVESGSVRPWDVPDGDAQLMPGVPDGQLDFAYSSHCLEHMRDVPESLKNWTRILKPG